MTKRIIENQTTRICCQLLEIEPSLGMSRHKRRGCEGGCGVHPHPARIAAALPVLGEGGNGDRPVLVLIPAERQY